MQVEVNIWPGMKTSGACPRKRTFAVSVALASAIENLVLTYLTGTIFNYFPSLVFLCLCCIKEAGGTPDLHSYRECFWRARVRTGDAALSGDTYWVGDTVCSLWRGKEQEHHWVQGKREPIAWYPEVPKCFGNFKISLKWSHSVASRSVQGERKVRYGVGVATSVCLRVAISSVIVSHIGIIICTCYWQDKWGTTAPGEAYWKLFLPVLWFPLFLFFFWTHT